MPIVVTCTNCDKKLRVPDELLGKKVKCPGCGTIFVGKVTDSAPAKDKPPTSVRSKTGAPSKEDSDDDEEQSEETSGGVQSKPSQKGSRSKNDDEDEPPERPSRARKKTKDDDEDEVPSKRRKGKDDDDDDDDRPSKRRKRKDDDDDDDDDDDRPSRRRRFADDDDDDDDDDDRPSRRPSRRRNYQAHKEALILILGIMSIACGIVICCWPLALFGGLGFGVPSIIMGQLDRRKMAAGQMDPAGSGLTMAGWICGIVGTCFGALQLFCILLRIVGFAGANAFDNNFGG